MVGLCCCFSLVVVSGRLLSSCDAQAPHCDDFSCCGVQDLRHSVFSSCSTWAQELWLTGSRAQTQYLWHTGLVILWHVGSFWIRDQSCISCIGRRILYHWTIREVLNPKFLMDHSTPSLAPSPDHPQILISNQSFLSLWMVPPQLIPPLLKMSHSQYTWPIPCCCCC